MFIDITEDGDVVAGGECVKVSDDKDLVDDGSDGFDQANICHQALLSVHYQLSQRKDSTIK